GQFTSAAGTVTVTVTPVDDPPTADPLSATTDEDTPLPLALTGDDGDPEAVQPLTFAVASSPTHGTLTGFNPATGAVPYTPAADYHGLDSFAFAVTDAGGLTSSAATVSITVRAVNDAPTAAVDSYTTDEDVTLVAPAAGVLGNDSDTDGDAITAELVS